MEGGGGREGEREGERDFVCKRNKKEKKRIEGGRLILPSCYRQRATNPPVKSIHTACELGKYHSTHRTHQITRGALDYVRPFVHDNTRVGRIRRHACRCFAHAGNHPEHGPYVTLIITINCWYKDLEGPERRRSSYPVCLIVTLICGQSASNGDDASKEYRSTNSPVSTTKLVGVCAMIV